MQFEWDQPIPVLDNDDLQPEQIDASPPYFAREALAIPRTQYGHHSPAYETHVPDPFTALQRNTIPFPTTRRNWVPPVPFRQWPNESDTSDSSDKSDRGQQQQWGTNAAGARLKESIPRLDHSSTTNPFNTEGPDYEWNTLEQIDQEILGPEQVEAWELRRADVEARTDWQHRGSREDMEYFLATNRGAPFHFSAPTDGELMARVYTTRNRELYCSHPGRRCPDLQARTEEEHRVLWNRLASLAWRLDERLHWEDNQWDICLWLGLRLPGISTRRCGLGGSPTHDRLTPEPSSPRILHRTNNE